jgi:hypothetical protein
LGLPPLVRADGGERAVEDADRGGDQRLFGKEAGVGDEIPRGEIVRAVGDQVVSAHQVERVGGDQPRRVHFHRDVRIEPADRGSRARDLGLADFGRAVDHLALQVGERHRVIVNDAKRADTGRRQV